MNYLFNADYNFLKLQNKKFCCVLNGVKWLVVKLCIVLKECENNADKDCAEYC